MGQDQPTDQHAHEPQTPWHAQPAERVFEALATSRDGLGAGDTQQRLERYGPNRLEQARPQSAWRRFVRQFHNILIYILIVAAIITALLGHWIDSGIIAAVVLINAAIGYFQEGKAEKALDAIRNMLSPQATVIRNGQRHTVPAEQLVPGDVVFVESGDRVPADLRLFRARDLRVDEAVLTGESVPVDKQTDPVDEDAAVGDRFSMAFASTFATSGQGYGIVTATGQATEIGQVSEMLAGVEELTTPLLRQVSTFGRWLSAVIVVVALGTLAFGVLVGGRPLDAMFLAAVGLAVAAIPEGLPAILTITLAIGVQRMADRNAIIRRLPAVDTLGSVTVICSDKTGTLTRNEMTVRHIAVRERVYGVTGVGYAPDGGFTLDNDDAHINPEDEPRILELLRAALLCNDAQLRHEDGRWQLHGDPTEGALLTAALKAELDRDAEYKDWPRTDAIPFESEHRFMATLHHSHKGQSVIYVKGAPERVLEMCSRVATAEGAKPIDPKRWREQIEAFANDGERVLAIACHDTHWEHTELKFEDVEGGLTLLGMVGMIDPPRDEAIEAIKQCRSAGIRVKMITGDHALTARAIGRQLGLSEGEDAMTGHDLDGLSKEQLEDTARRVNVFARVSPAHKLTLVEAVQARHEVVAMTGDGVNDAPALKRADVGIAMGQKGTEVSKEASDMVLADDNFASIAHAVEEGRTVYKNLQKAILFLLPTNGGQSLIIILAILLGFTLPITPVQILWVNMVTAVTLALALAFEPPEEDIMHRPPREPDAPLLSRFFLWRIGFVSLLLCAGPFAFFAWLRAGDASYELASTAAVNTLVFCQVVYLFNTRYIKDHVLSLKGLFGNRYVWLAIGLLAVLQGLYTYLPLAQVLFANEGLAATHWLVIAAVGLAAFFLVEAEKWAVRRWEASRGRVAV